MAVFWELSTVNHFLSTLDHKWTEKRMWVVFFFLIFIFFLWSQLADCAVQAQYGNSSGKWAHMQLIRKLLSTVLSVHWATVDWSSAWKSKIGGIRLQSPLTCFGTVHITKLVDLFFMLNVQSAVMVTWRQTQAIILQAKVPFTFHVSCHVTVEEDWETNEAEWTNWEGRNKKGSTLSNWWNLSSYIQTYSRLRNKIFDSTRDLEKM